MPRRTLGNAASIAITGGIGLVLLFQLIPQAPEEQPTQPLKQPATIQKTEPPATDSDNTTDGIAITLPPPPVVQAVVDRVTPEPPARPEPAKPIKPARTIIPLKSQPKPASKPVKAVQPLKPQAPIKKQTIVKMAMPLKPELIEKKAPQKFQQEAPAAPQKKQIKVSTATSSKTVKEGRVLLRMLEHGDSPSIEIVWPASAQQRKVLFNRLTRCYGMKTALMDTGGNLYIAEGRRGKRWNLNMDRYSGFVRQPTGYLAELERLEASRIRRYHGTGSRLATVRIFPRKTDALLLGGLSRLLGSQYKTSKQILAQYRLQGSQLIIDSIQADNRPVSGQIVFGGGGRCT